MLPVLVCEQTKKPATPATRGVPACHATFPVQSFAPHGRIQLLLYNPPAVEMRLGTYLFIGIVHIQLHLFCLRVLYADLCRVIVVRRFPSIQDLLFITSEVLQEYARWRMSSMPMSENANKLRPKCIIIIL